MKAIFEIQHKNSTNNKTSQASAELQARRQVVSTHILKDLVIWSVKVIGYLMASEWKTDSLKQMKIYCAHTEYL